MTHPCPADKPSGIFPRAGGRGSLQEGRGYPTAQENPRPQTHKQGRNPVLQKEGLSRWKGPEAACTCPKPLSPPHQLCLDSTGGREPARHTSNASAVGHGQWQPCLEEVRWGTGPGRTSWPPAPPLPGARVGTEAAVTTVLPQDKGRRKEPSGAPQNRLGGPPAVGCCLGPCRSNSFT